ncbi:MAG: sulfotransferase [Synechococcales bacterium]|nr:sulfotransferase [Synechococcales bacterium]
MDLLMDKQATSTALNQLCTDPIFILGIMPRCGTNFLYNLLCLHPHCNGVGIRDMPEDHLLLNANLLERYANNVASFWSRHGLRGENDPARQRYNQELQSKLFASLGEGLLAYLNHLNPDSGVKPLVTKTPFVRNLSRFFHLFPQARLIILVRDGRAVAESSVKSFNTSYEVMIHRWAEAAHEILAFDQAHRHTDAPYLIVRYEDILDHLEVEMRSILNFLGLSPDVYDFDMAVNLPVFGSSEEFAKAREAAIADPEKSGWKVVDKCKQKFNPKSRWSHWSADQHCRFNWIAGSYMEQFGYELEAAQSSLGGFRNQALDLKWASTSWAMAQIHRWERILYAIYTTKRRYQDLRMEDEDTSFWIS